MHQYVSYTDAVCGAVQPQRALPFSLSRGLGELTSVGTVVTSHLRQKFLSAQPGNAFGNICGENGSAGGRRVID